MPESLEKTVFLAALELETPADRRAYLERTCVGNPALRAAVDELLAAHEQTRNVLDCVPEAVGAFRAGFDSGSMKETASLGFSPDSPSPIAEGPGTVVGPYKLMEQIGEGGFGYVFVAEQQRPVRRKVALKVVKPGMDSREVIARFEAERQALALMDHPNIARVFDAGTTATGRPYFVMELVRGVPATRFCEETRITVPQRLELFISICNAVQHAHQKGVIHRDLKPPNILVTLHDGTPVVKVIDFGVAKAMGEPLTNKTIYTRFTQVIGTPLYMSPEQIEMSGLDVDTRSDIYSLGVLLYEILTGTTPFDRERLQSVSFDELRRIIREEEPPRPSVRLTTVQQEVTMPTARSLSPKAPPLLVRGDLDWIVMKALEKDRTRRYATAAEMAADVRRFLRQEPIAARPPSPFYRFSKFARRNKIFFTTTSLVLAALVLGTAVSTWQAIRANAARSEADALKQEALDFVEDLKAANVLLDNARANADGERWATACDEFTRATQLAPDHYLVWSGRAALFMRLGLWDLAAADYEKAIELGAAPSNPGWWGVPQLFLYAGKTDAYRRAAAEMLEQSQRSSDHLFRLVSIRAACAAGDSVGEPEELAAAADTLVDEPFERAMGREFPELGPPGLHGRDPGRPPVGEMGRPPRLSPGRPPGGEFGGEFGGPTGNGVPRELRLYTAGLAHFRAGHTEKAIDYLQASTFSDHHNPIQPIAYPVLALAYHQVGQHAAAQEALTEARDAFDQMLDTMEREGVSSVPMPSFDFIEFLLLFREANRVLTGSTFAEGSRLSALQEQAFEVIHTP